MRTQSASLAHVFVVLLATGCGDDDGSSGSVACAPFTPCGGDPIGAWQVTGACDTEPSGQVSEPYCSVGTAVTERTDASGSFEFVIDGALLVTLEQTVQVRFEWECEIPCFEVQQHLMSDGLPSTTCRSANGKCVCRVSGSGHTDSTGTWSDGTSLLTIPLSDGSTFSADYCIDGDQMELRETDGSIGFTLRPL